MNCVIENLEYLIHRHDCVVVPSLGAFIATYESARYDATTAQFFPPKRIISFNPDVDHNDGLIASSVARRNRISYPQATRLVAGEVAKLKQNLADTGSVGIGNIGRFINQPGSTPIFRPSVSMSATESSLLKPIRITPITKQCEKRPIAPVRKRRKELMVAIKTAAAFAIALTIGAILLFPAITREDNMAAVSTAEINAGMNTSQTAQVVQSEPEHKLFIALPAKEDRKEELSDNYFCAYIPATPQPPIRINPADRYCLVVASLPSANLAAKFIGERGDTSLEIYVCEGKYRVYAATGNSAAALEEVKATTQLAKYYPDAWVCRMN